MLFRTKKKKCRFFNKNKKKIVNKKISPNDQPKNIYYKYNIRIN